MSFTEHVIYQNNQYPILNKHGAMILMWDCIEERDARNDTPKISQNSLPLVWITLFFIELRTHMYLVPWFNNKLSLIFRAHKNCSLFIECYI